MSALRTAVLERIAEAARQLSEAHANIRTDTPERLDALNAALAAIDALPIGGDAVWRHRKRGTTYRIEEPITAQCETPIQDGEELTRIAPSMTESCGRAGLPNSMTADTSG